MEDYSSIQNLDRGEFETRIMLTFSLFLTIDFFNDEYFVYFKSNASLILIHSIFYINFLIS